MGFKTVKEVWTEACGQTSIYGSHIFVPVVWQKVGSTPLLIKQSTKKKFLCYSTECTWSFPMTIPVET